MTALAIIIGIASVIAMLSIGAGAQKALENDRCSWWKNSKRVRWPNTARVLKDHAPLEIKDAEALRRFKDFSWEIAPEMKDRRQIQFENANFSAQIGGYWSNHDSARVMRLKGRFLLKRTCRGEGLQ